jgi:hypothetical protein
MLVRTTEKSSSSALTMSGIEGKRNPEGSYSTQGQIGLFLSHLMPKLAKTDSSGSRCKKKLELWYQKGNTLFL